MIGLQKVSEDTQDQNLEEGDDTEWNTSLASACALEHMALVMKNNILGPAFDFI